jgi:probable phosphoglycerate mutase
MRHGQTFWNAEGRLQGNLHSSLTPQGILQAQAQAQIVSGLAGRCFSSPQGRAQQTADIVFRGRGCSIDARLSEIGIGDFAGQLLTEVQTRQPQIFQRGPLDWYNHCPQGEGFAALETRCRSFLAGLDRPTLVVTHGMTLRMICVLALGGAVDNIADYDIDQGAVYHIRGSILTTLPHADNNLHQM